MPADQIGRWTGANATEDSGLDTALAVACSIHAMNELSKDVEPSPPVAQLIIARPDGTSLGVLALDAQDAETLTKRVHEMSNDRYGPLLATDLEKLMRRYRSELQGTTPFER